MLENVLEGKKSGEWTISRKMAGQKAQEDYIGTETRAEIGKGNQMIALRFQTREKQNGVIRLH